MDVVGVGGSVGGRCGHGAERPEDAGDRHGKEAERRPRRRGQEGTAGGPSRPGEHRCCCSTAPCWLVSVRLSRGAGGSPEPLAAPPTPAKCALRIQESTRVQRSSVLLFCSRWLNIAFLIFMPKNILLVPLRKDGWGMCPVQEEPVPVQRPAPIVLPATRAVLGQ